MIGPSNAEPNLDSSLDLLQRAQGGDERALNELCARYRRELRDWARSRLPAGARSLRETEDLVQETLMRVLTHIRDFHPRHEGALLAYLRQAMMNRIRDEIRRTRRLPAKVELRNGVRSSGIDPLQEVLRREVLERYEAALQKLKPEEREAVIARVELGKSNPEVAALLGRPSADAARMFVARSLLRLAEKMRDEE